MNDDDWIENIEMEHNTNIGNNEVSIAWKNWERSKTKQV